MVIPGFAGVTADDPVKITYKDGLCEHHPEHEEDCYIDNDFDEDATSSDAEKREPENCPHICDEESGCITWTLDCPCGQDEDDMGICDYVCDICEEELATDSNASQVIISAEYVQELIDALPDAEDITEENADEVIDQLEAIDDAKLLLTDEERELLDLTKYDAAAAALGSVYEVATLANAVKVGDFEVTTDGVLGTDYTYDSGVLTILTSTPLTIKNEDPETYTTDRIVVKTNISANVTLAGVNIDVSGSDYVSSFEIEKDSAGSVVITFADNTNNLLKIGMCSVALKKEGTNGSLLIQCEQSDE